MIIRNYALTLNVEQSLMLPKHSILLSLQLYLGYPMVFVSIPDTEAELEEVVFSTYGLGQQVDNKLEQYLDTYQLGGRVWCVFYRREIK